MGQESCPLHGLDQYMCESIIELSRRYGIKPERLVVDILSSVAAAHSPLIYTRGISYEALLSLLAGSLGLLGAIENLLFRGFGRLLELMTLSDTDCYAIRENAGCEEATGFLLSFDGKHEKAPPMLTLGIGYSADEPSVLFVEFEANIVAGDDEPVGRESSRIATRAVSRTISYARRTKHYMELEDYLADIGSAWWSLELSPGDLVADGVPEIVLSAGAASSVPGYVLPFNLNYLLDFTLYLRERLQKEYEKIIGAKELRK